MAVIYKNHQGVSFIAGFRFSWSIREIINYNIPSRFHLAWVVFHLPQGLYKLNVSTFKGGTEVEVLEQFSEAYGDLSEQKIMRIASRYSARGEEKPSTPIIKKGDIVFAPENNSFFRVVEADTQSQFPRIKVDLGTSTSPWVASERFQTLQGVANKPELLKALLQR